MRKLAAVFAMTLLIRLVLIACWLSTATPSNAQVDPLWDHY